MDFAYVYAYLHGTSSHAYVYYPIIQNKHMSQMQTGYVLAGFLFWWNKFFSMIYRVVLSLELTYNGARDLYACMEQQKIGV